MIVKRSVTLLKTDVRVHTVDRKSCLFNMTCLLLKPYLFLPISYQAYLYHVLEYCFVVLMKIQQEFQ